MNQKFPPQAACPFKNGAESHDQSYIGAFLEDDIRTKVDAWRLNGKIAHEALRRAPRRGRVGAERYAA